MILIPGDIYELRAANTLFRVRGWYVGMLFQRRYDFREAWGRETDFFSLQVTAKTRNTVFEVLCESESLTTDSS